MNLKGDAQNQSKGNATLCENEYHQPGWMRQQDFVKPFTSIGFTQSSPILPGGWVLLSLFMRLWHLRLRKVTGLGLRSHCWRIGGENGGKGGFSWLQPPERVTEVRLPGVPALTPGPLSSVCGYITAYWTPPSDALLVIPRVLIPKSGLSSSSHTAGHACIGIFEPTSD